MWKTRKKGEHESIKKKCKNVRTKREMGRPIFGSAEVKPARALFLVPSDERENNATASSSIALDVRLFIRKSQAHSPRMQINQDNQHRVISKKKKKGKKKCSNHGDIVQLITSPWNRRRKLDDKTVEWIDCQRVSQNEDLISGRLQF